MAKGRSGVVGRVALRQSLLGYTKSAQLQIKSRARGAAGNAAFIAKSTGQQTILNTPSSLSPGKPDRYWTGAMFRAYDGTVVETGNKFIVKFGWVSTKKGYFKIQEHGGFAFGKTVTPMHALANSLVAAQDYLSSKGIK